MKLGNTARIEIMALVLEGLSTGTDISEKIRQMDLVEENGVLELSADYVKSHPRASDWGENN